MIFGVQTVKPGEGAASRASHFGFIANRKRGYPLRHGQSALHVFEVSSETAYGWFSPSGGLIFGRTRFGDGAIIVAGCGAARDDDRVLDVVISTEVYRATSLLRLRHALWAAIIAYRILDPRLIAVAHRRLAAALRHWLLVESLYSQPNHDSHD